MNHEQLTEDLFNEYERKFQGFYDQAIKDLDLKEAMDAYKNTILSHMLIYSDELRFDYDMILNLYDYVFTYADTHTIVELENLIDRTTYLNVRDVVRQVYNNID